MVEKMPDIFDKATRSLVMQKIRGKTNKSTELKLIELFSEYGIIGWRRSYPAKGHPDFVFLKKKIAVFVDGCFWHGHDCRNTRPKENQEFWIKKREYSKKHDAQVTASFENRGWTVMRIWKCELKNKNRLVLLDKIKDIL